MNGVYPDYSVPNLSNRGVGQGASYPVPGARPGNGKSSPPTPSYSGKSPSGHDGRGNSTYSK